MGRDRHDQPYMPPFHAYSTNNTCISITVQLLHKRLFYINQVGQYHLHKKSLPCCANLYFECEESTEKQISIVRFVCLHIQMDQIIVRPKFFTQILVLQDRPVLFEIETKT